MGDPTNDFLQPVAPARASRPVLFWVATAFWSLWLVGQVARDHTWFTGICFDIPSPIPAAFCVVAAAILAIRGRRRRAMALALLAFAPLGSIAFVENRWSRPERPGAPGNPIRLVHWNVAYGIHGRGGVRRALIDRKAMIYVLSEYPGQTTQRIAARLGQGFTGVRLGTLVVVAQGRLGAPQIFANDNQLKVYSTTWEGPEGTVEILAVDVVSDPLVFRDPLLRRIHALVEAHRPDIVVGDFNSPRRSRALWPLPEGYVHAYDAVGSGWSATWPVPFPMLAIDQCFFGPRIAPVRYDIQTTSASDHRLQVFDFHVARFAAAKSQPAVR